MREDMVMKDKPSRLRPFANPTGALLWEQWRMFRPFLAGAVFMAAAGTLGLYVNVLQDMVSRSDALLLSDFVRRLCSVFLPALFCANFAGGVSFAQRLYRLPVSTRRMVLYVAVPRLAFLLLTLLVLLGFRMLLLGAPDWDGELRMTVLSVLALVAGLAVSWSLGAVGDWMAICAQTVVIGVAYALFDILGVRDVRQFLGPDILWPLAGLWAVLGSLLIFAGPDRARSGISLLHRLRRGGRASAKVRALPGGSMRLKRFSSPFEAQAWYERRTRGYAGALYPLLFMTVLALLILRADPIGVTGFLPAFMITACLAALTVGACFVVTAARRLMEAHRVRAGRLRFLAAKPISTQDLARVRLHAMLCGAETAVLFALAVLLFFWLLPPMPVLLSPQFWPLWLAEAYQATNGTVLTWALVWVLLVWLSASLTAVSSPLVLALLAVFPLLRLGSVYGPVAAFMNHGGDVAVIALWGLGLLGHAAHLFFRAHRREILSPVTMLLCLAVYALLAKLLVTPISEQLVDVLLRYYHGLIQPASFAACTLAALGLIALVIAPFAALPLQFDRWRHGGK